MSDLPFVGGIPYGGLPRRYPRHSCLDLCSRSQVPSIALSLTLKNRQHKTQGRHYAFTCSAWYTVSNSIKERSIHSETLGKSVKHILHAFRINSASQALNQNCIDRKLGHLMNFLKCSPEKVFPTSGVLAGLLLFFTCTGVVSFTCTCRGGEIDRVLSAFFCKKKKKLCVNYAKATK